ncbi:hypothetical protein U1Q18_019381, partial [Sarracenia purpurea var. burkii]
PGEFRLSSSPAPLPGPLDACPLSPHRRTSDALRHCVSRPSPVAAVTFHRTATDSRSSAAASRRLGGRLRSAATTAPLPLPPQISRFAPPR